MPAKSRILMLITRLVYAAYAALAVYSSFEAQKIFKGKQTDVQDGEYYYCHGASGESSCRMPVSMCLLSGDLSDIAEHCEGTGLIKNIVPVSAALSVAAVLIYCLMDLIVRCKLSRAQKKAKYVSAGVAGGFGAALAFLLFQSMWNLFTVAFLCD